MYKKTGTITPAVHQFLKDVAKRATWKIIKGSGRDYLTSFCGDDVKGVFPWENWSSAFFLKLPPDGRVHPHIDVNHAWNTYHVIVQTNPKAISYAIDTGGTKHEFKPVVKGIYLVNRQIEHWAVNNGKSDRIHLLCEVYE